MKNHHHGTPTHPSKKSVIHEAIAARAYELWLQAGQPEDQAEANWLAAEGELVTGRRAPRATPVLLPVSF